MELVIGGSGSGKSAYAEQAATLLAKENNSRKYYLATMRVSDEESKKRADRHRNLRKGKGFLTIEQPTDIQQSLRKIESGNKIVLLECISNLTANEMFKKESMAAEDFVIKKVIHDIAMLKKELSHFIIVSNNVFEDGVDYDKTTMEYIRVMAKINQQLAGMADQVTEVVAGIPIAIKFIGKR